MVVAVINLRAVAISMPINGSPTLLILSQYRSVSKKERKSTCFNDPWMSLLVVSLTQQCFEVWCYDSDQIFWGILGLQQRSLPVCFSLRLTVLPWIRFGTYGNSPLHELYFQRFGRWRNWQFLLHRKQQTTQKKQGLRWIQGKNQRFTSPKKMAS